ncbi:MULTISPECIES: RNA polymerase sigma factor [unclassified Clostridium]|mgnify:CR=1 FL=1|uniref:RNA polymerase sigma factor n=1 Tax=Clostridium TaxID=1485 RepID=UPI001C8C05F6|nr:MULTISPECIES: sigma-70 family RNA polymerase sigma factor [unclassified Clostridium]MBX9138396.1 sigma-70 family RNA polymerase sigma factor [Clostridium sp. K12(2020)]MBX9145111.1 sigma-70 family RNA polymerase sigma factor [Clostridium sp. K13]MDU2290408.1 sigma-70 family RNA polymerase sigma factor [Clostridium celatum]
MIKIRGKSLEKRFEQEVIDNKEKLYRLAYYYVKNHHDAMDILQESILKGYSNLSKIKDKDSIDKYLSRIIINTAIDFIRKNSKMIFTDDECLKEVESEVNSSDINYAVDNLEEDLKSIIVLKYFHGYKISEVAEILDISISTVKNRMHKALKQLRVEIKEEIYE